MKQTPIAKNDHRAQARILKALAHESRLKIVDKLKDGPCTAGELVRLVGSDQSTVSKHLSVLKAHGIVDDRKAGREVRYELLIPCVLDFFTCACRVIRERK